MSSMEMDLASSYNPGASTGLKTQPQYTHENNICIFGYFKC